MTISISQEPMTSVGGFIPEADQWVQLRDPLTDYSADEALLLCEEVEDYWVAWIPSYGEARVRREQLLKAID
ncbi:hypothetical protein NEA10_01265 [Phormidium yuhuli AB48]|uniref:Uncharacterized protein n=1 Tax=Phormidium yuhuli AB48 TaxID=2940671 RepID=A0ABY5AQV4_9CYAN|nr:hypothetical protein [Phormidium yuhuli]USR91400.1 hypothetical protein NEA10_01265 [Phormidium yuhuli AB48]